MEKYTINVSHYKLYYYHHHIKIIYKLILAEVFEIEDTIWNLKVLLANYNG